MDLPTSAAESSSDPFELRHAATDHATIVRVPERRLIAVDGVGSPVSSGFRLATSSLRTAGENLRAHLHRSRALETRVGIVECAWWIHPEVEPAEMAEAFVDRSTWHWQQMIEVPEGATDQEVEAVIDQTRLEAGRELPLIRTIRFAEGRAAQILHVGGAPTEIDAVRRLLRANAILESRRLDAQDIPPGSFRLLVDDLVHQDTVLVQRVTVEVDALGGQSFEGKIQSIAAATGARFSLLPPENATGNYVKVVQRVPVKIVLDPGQDPEHRLRPGMSVAPVVHLR